jgi:tetratricopeptide (TPR) repeat protein
VAGSFQNLAAVLKDLGRFREADSLAARAYDIFRSTTPQGHYLPAFPLLTRSEILLEAGDSALAAVVAAEALAILEPALPADHFAVGVARCRLGAALLGSGRIGEARAEIDSGVRILREDARTRPAYLEECEETARRAAGR